MTQQSKFKTIRSRGDLAVNGAPPAFEQLLHVGRPNIGDKARYLALLDEMIDRRWLTNNGPLLEEFEQKIASYLGVRHVVAMCNGTIALEIAIRALGLSGEVIVPSYTFIATTHAVHWQGLTPVFADIDPHTHCLDPKSVRQRISSRTSGIIAVHIWGRSAPVGELEELADEFNLKLIFDSAHAFGNSVSGRMIGSFGACEVFSFHATKFFNSLEGGAVSTNDDALADRMKLMRNFGFSGYDNVVHPGTNGKMTEACAAMGIVNLESIDVFIEANKRNYDAYVAHLRDVPHLRLLPHVEDEKSNHQYIVVEIADSCATSRDEIVDTLHAENVIARKYFWPGCHKMAPYRDLFPQADTHLPVTNDVAARVIVLPNGTAVDNTAVETICDILKVLV